MSKKPPAFQLYAADFYMDTLGWSVDEVGIYFRLLMHEWVNGPFPDDPRRLARITECTPKRFQKGFVQVRLKFSKNSQNLLYNKRLEEVRQAQESYIKSQELAGKLGAERRWKKDSDPIADPNGNPNSETMALHSSSSTLKNKDIKAADAPVDNSKDPREQEVIEICNAIAKEIPRKTFNPHQWNHHHRNKNPSARIHTLKRIVDEVQTILDYKIQEPWGYADQILKCEEGNYNEREYVKEHKIDFNDVVAKLKQMQEAEK